MPLLKHDTLVILTPGFPKNETDTTWLPLQQSLLKTIKQNNPGLKIIVLTFQYPHKKRSYMWNEIRVEAFGGKGKAKLFRMYTWMRVWRKLKRINKLSNIEGILSFWLGECAFVGEQFARKHKLKHHCWILGQDAKAGNRYSNMIKPKSHTLIALSDFVARNIHDHYGVMPAHIIPGGIDTTLFGNESYERTIDVIGVGSLIPLKQFHLFIEVVCRLKKNFPGIKAVICGDGPEKATLTRMIRQLRMEEHIAIKGELPHSEVLQLMQRSKICIHPSNYEGLGMVCLEALYAGAKVVSFVKPLDAEIENWHVTDSTYDMANIAGGILRDEHVQYQPVLPYHMADIAAHIVRLYINKPLAIPRTLLAIASNDKLDS